MTRARHQTEKDEIAHEILAYLADHPDAEDTLEGIVQWWLLERQVQKIISSVRSALIDLVREGALIQETIAGTSVYRISPTTAKSSKGADDR